MRQPVLYTFKFGYRMKAQLQQRVALMFTRKKNTSHPVTESSAEMRIRPTRPGNSPGLPLYAAHAVREKGVSLTLNTDQYYGNAHIPPDDP